MTQILKNKQKTKNEQQKSKFVQLVNLRIKVLGCLKNQQFSFSHTPFPHALRLFFLFKNYLFIYLWLCWVFVSARGLSLVAASRGHSSSRCADLSLSRPLLLGSTGSRRAGSVIVAHGPSCSVACGILPDQGSNPCPLHGQADSQPLRHQGSLTLRLLFYYFNFFSPFLLHPVHFSSN